jgi:hypothetical protein
MSTAGEVTNQDDPASVRLLPLSKDPFQVPTDRDMLPSERRLFVRTHRTCVFGYARRADGPAMSIVYYVPAENDDLLVATMGARAKAKAVARVAERMSGEPLSSDLRPMVKAMGEQEGRVLIRCRPYSTFATPPRHLHRNNQDEPLTHWLSSSVPWHASDRPAEG